MMSSTQLFSGQSIRLTALNPETDAPIIAGWYADRVFARHALQGPGRPLSAAQLKKQMEANAKEQHERFDFAIRLNADDRLIGVGSLDRLLWHHGSAWIHVVIGSADDRNEGYGRQAIDLLIRYAFGELNLHRLTAEVGADNAIALRVFQRHGFRIEGRFREALLHAGRRWDLFRLGLVRGESAGPPTSEPTALEADGPKRSGANDTQPTTRLRLIALEPTAQREAMARWSQDSEFMRLFDSTIVRPRPATGADDETGAEVEVESYDFHLALAAGDDHPERIIGAADLWVDWPHGDCWLGVGIGVRELWGQGYGTQALQQLLTFAFDELGVQRVSLDVRADNQRAIRAYAAAGFVLEGRMRASHAADGQRQDDLLMGLLRREWQARRPAATIETSSDGLRFESITAATRPFVDAIFPGDQSKFWVHHNSHMLTVAEQRDGLAARLVYVEPHPEPVGFLVFGASFGDLDGREPEPGHYELHHLVIDQAHQGRGYGRRATLLALDLMRARPDCRRLVIAHNPANAAARRLYQSLGFQPAGQRADGDDVLMLAG